MNSTTPHEFAPQLRPDLQWSWHTEPPRWIARDPLTAGFFSFNDVERHATMLMNGRQSVGEILQQLGQRFPSSLLDRPWLHSLLARLQAHHLLSPGPTDDPRRWTQWRQRQRRRGRLQQLMSPLAIRVPLLDPSPLLRYMQAPAKLLFHPLMVALWLVSGGLLLFMVLREFLGSHFSLNFDLQAIHGDRWLILFLCYVVAKSLHELGHALACVRRNTACNEIGLLFLCFAPCLYCDTTDSWKLPSKWQRAGIAAAGMYVELILATLAAGLWLLTSEGTLHYVAASMMVVCSLGTLLVNSNPLLKYDGYYILSDLWGVPNLSEQSREATRALIRYALTAQPPQQSRLDANVWLLAAYAVLASVYRLFVLGVILWFSWQVLVPLGLGLVALAITAVLMLGMLLSQLRSWQGLYRELFTAGRVRVVRLLLCGTLALSLLAALFYVPLPRAIRARGFTDFLDKRPLFASQSAELVFAAPTGSWIPQGSPLLELASAASQLEWVALQGEIAELLQELQQLRQRQTIDATSAYQIPAKQERLVELRAREKLMARELAALVQHAPYGGYLLKSPLGLAPALTAPRDDRFRPHPLDPASLGCSLERSALLGWFSPKQQLSLTALLPERDVKKLRIGTPVSIQWDSALSQIGQGEIRRIAPDPASETPAELVGDPSLHSIRDEQGRFQPETPHYQVTIEVVSSVPHPLRGASATIQIPQPPQTLFERGMHYLRQNLKPIY